MAVPRPTHRSAAIELASREPVIATLMEAVGPPKVRPPLETHFAALLRAIVYQQLAGSAASAIHRRVITALDDSVTPAAVLATSELALRAAGLSGNKLLSIRDLSAKVLEGTVILDPRRLSRVSDDEMITRLSEVRGIGRWTAEMFLLFQLRRMDVWPTGDLGVRKGYGLAFGIEMPSAKVLEPLGERFRPYRSVVAWYCWRACDLYAAAGKSALTT